MSFYERCEACAGAREAGEFDSVVNCHGCNGKGLRRVPSSYVCNKCGESLCPNVSSPNADYPHGLVEAVVSGGYDSPHLTDGSTYKFSLCEKCLRELFEACKVPPSMASSVFGNGGEDSYEEEREWYRHRVWRDAGGQKAKLATGICNREESCTEPAAWRIFVSSSLSDEACCETHRRGGSGNYYFVPVAAVAGIPLDESLRTVEDRRRLAEAWLGSAQRPVGYSYFRYLGVCLLDLLPGTPEETSGLWVPGTILPPWTGALSRMTLSTGTLFYGPEESLRSLTKQPNVRPAKILPNLPAEEGGEED